MSNDQTPVEFTGKAGEYFSIWIVNLLLSIITLGVYSAWAKVRRKKYFYNNTLIDGVGFDYHARPIAILKGRIIAFVLLVLYSVLSGFSPILGALLALVLFLAIPWIVVRGMTFNARNSSHRGLRFDFDGRYGQAALVFIGYTLLSIFTLGLAIPFVAQRTHKFIVSHHKFGTSHFNMGALVKDFYKIYLIIFLIPLLGILAAVAIPAYQQYKAKITSLNETQYIQQVSTNMPNNIYAGSFIKVADITTGEEIASDEALAAAQERLTETEWMSEEDYLSSLTPVERTEYDAQIKAYENGLVTGSTGDLDDKKVDSTLKKKDPLAKVFDSISATWGIVAAIFVGILVMVLYLAFIFSFAAYMKSRIQNLVWNNTTLDQVRFFSNQRMRDLVLLYLTNAIALIFTIGLATPWVQIRMARYRAEHLALSGETDWNKFVGEKKEASKAMGEEIAEMFDVDLSFG
ncbi:MAG: YjgN family protein [Methylotenera sp.]|nr:YjgN family protein [Methylotenera sp.]